MKLAKTCWNFRQSDPRQVRQLAQRFKVDPLVAQIMVQRGIDDPTRAEQYLFPDMKRLSPPEGIPGIVAAADLIEKAIADDRTIVIFSDYDVDGVCGLTILAECLRLAGSKHVVPYIPHRLEEGYGLNLEAVQTLAAEYPGALLITVDCGISGVKEVAEAKKLGLSVIVTDHHVFKDELPPADVLVHPALPGADPFTAKLCGAGVAFKLSWQIANKFGDGKKASPAMRDFLLRTMGLVAMATVADVMPLVDENRILVKHGINSLNKRRTAGLDALFQIAEIKPDKQVNSGTIGFQIAPRINVAGRLSHAFTAYRLLTTTNPEEAQELSKTLDETNRLRKEIESDIVRSAKLQFESDPRAAERNVVVVADQNWHQGVVGIAASRLMETYNRPAIVLSINDTGMAHGSGRTAGGVNLVEALEECKEFLPKFGGHAAAAGMTLAAASIDEFREAFDQAVGQRRKFEVGLKNIWIDAEVSLAQLDVNLVRAIEDLEPHGEGNASPLFAAAGLELVKEPFVMGAERNHLKLRFQQGKSILEVVAWGKADMASEFEMGERYDVAFSLQLNEWNKRVTVQGILKDARPATGSALA